MKKDEIKHILENECSIPRAYYDLSSDEIESIVKKICTKLNISTYDASNLFKAYREVQSVENWNNYIRGQWLKDNTGTYDYSDNFSSIRTERERAYHNYNAELNRVVKSIELNNSLENKTFDFNLIKDLKNVNVSINQLVNEDLKRVWNLYDKYYLPLLKLNTELDNCILEEQEKNNQLTASLKEYSEYMDSKKLNNYFQSKKLDLYRSFSIIFRNMEKFAFFPKKVRDAMGRLWFVREANELENDKLLNGSKTSQFVPVFKIDDYTSGYQFEEKDKDKNSFSEELSTKIEFIEKIEFSAKFIQSESQEISIEYLEQLFKNNINPSTINDINLKSLYELYISLNKKSQKVELTREYNVKINDYIIKILSELASIETRYQSDVNSTFENPINSLLSVKPHFLKKIIHFRDINFSTDYELFIKQIKDFKLSYAKGYYNKKLIDSKNDKSSLMSKKNAKNIFQYISQFVSKYQNNMEDELISQDNYIFGRRK